MTKQKLYATDHKKLRVRRAKEEEERDAAESTVVMTEYGNAQQYARDLLAGCSTEDPPPAA
jgi:hypothetical protein